MALMMADNLVVFDHVRHRITVIANLRAEADLRAAYADAVARIDHSSPTCAKPLTPPVTGLPAGDQWRSNFTQTDYEAWCAPPGIHRRRRHLPGGAEPAP